MLRFQPRGKNKIYIKFDDCTLSVELEDLGTDGIDSILLPVSVCLSVCLSLSVCVRAFVCVRACVHECVCVCERERERERAGCSGGAGGGGGGQKPNVKCGQHLRSNLYTVNSEDGLYRRRP